MKKNILFLGVFLVVSNLLVAQPSKFVIQTKNVSKLVIVDQETNETYAIPEFKKSSGGYLFSCDHPKMSSIKSTHNKPIQLMIFWIDKNQRTKWIELAPNEMLSFDNAFEQQDASSYWDGIWNTWDAIASFFSDAKNGTIEQGNEAALKVSGQAIFDKPNNFAFFTKKAFHFAWDPSFENKTISITDLNTNKEILNQKITEKQISYKDLPSKTKRKLKRNHNYQLTLKANHKSVTTNFTIYSKKEYKTLKQFIKQ